MAHGHRTPVLTGNWKMHKTIDQATQFIESLAAKIDRSQESRLKLFLAVPFTAISPLKKKVEDEALPFIIGAQNMHDASQGAFTGEIASSMLQEIGAQFVLLGHSERRHLFGESNEFINRKVLRAVETGITPILCVGESITERENGQTFSVLEKQITECLEGVRKEGASSLMLAYEPLWAIGTGKVAHPEDAEKAHLFCREKIAALFGEEIAQHIVIQYGGSVRPENAAALFAQENIDGLLIGGASLDEKLFYEIIKQCESQL